MNQQVHLGYDEVMAIESVGEIEMYDFEIPETHCYFANGILVHNSGSIEQDADIVLLLHRPELYDPAKEKGILYVGIAKVRQIGKTGVIKLVWNEKERRYRDLVQGDT